jgi:hypothetical protein
VVLQGLQIDVGIGGYPGGGIPSYDRTKARTFLSFGEWRPRVTSTSSRCGGSPRRSWVSTLQSFLPPLRSVPRPRPLTCLLTVCPNLKLRRGSPKMAEPGDATSRFAVACYTSYVWR